MPIHLSEEEKKPQHCLLNVRKPFLSLSRLGQNSGNTSTAKEMLKATLQATGKPIIKC